MTGYEGYIGLLDQSDWSTIECCARSCPKIRTVPSCKQYELWFHWTKIYPIALICVSPLFLAASLPHVLLSSPCPPEPNPIITGSAAILAVTQNSNPCFGPNQVTPVFRRLFYIKSFFVAIGLQWNLRTNQPLPRVTTQWGCTVFAISDQWVERLRLPRNGYVPNVTVDLHTKTDFGEWCVPISR